MKKQFMATAAAVAMCVPIAAHAQREHRERDHADAGELRGQRIAGGEK